jgi:acyl-CoA synthetase (AMP-forming)/AMP-acid ligase II
MNIVRNGQFHLTAFLADAAERRPDQTLTVDGMEFTYEQAWVKVLSIATWLQRNGVNKGDKVLTVLRHSPELHLITLAAAHVGAVVSVLSPQLRAEGFGHIVEESQPACIFLEKTTRHLKKAAENILTVWMDEGVNTGEWDEAEYSEVMNTKPAWGMRYPGTSQDPAFLVFAGESTASTRAVLLSHDNVRTIMCQNAENSADGFLSVFDSVSRESHLMTEMFARLND